MGKGVHMNTSRFTEVKTDGSTAQVMLRNELAQEVLRKPDPSRIRTVVVDDSPTFLQVAANCWSLIPPSILWHAPEKAAKPLRP
jgi:hypothetical protein